MVLDCTVVKESDTGKSPEAEIFLLENGSPYLWGRVWLNSLNTAESDHGFRLFMML